MDFDFNLILVPATLLFFVIWLMDKLVWKQRARVKAGKLAQENMWVGFGYDFFPVLAAVLIVRSFLFEPFNIPSESMNPTLLTGDFIIVNKYAFGERLPILNTEIFDSGKPKRGDVAVFRYPYKPSINYIKRVIGLPGDKIAYNNGRLTINGQLISKVAQPELGDQISQHFSQEQMGEHKHLILELDGVVSPSSAFTRIDGVDSTVVPFILQVDGSKNMPYMGRRWEVTVPAKSYFMMGDNRDNSTDSRYWGFVPEANLSGRAVYIWMHKDPGLHWPSFTRNGVIN